MRPLIRAIYFLFISGVIIGAKAQVPSTIVRDAVRKIESESPEQLDRKAIQEKVPYLENAIENYNQCIRKSGARGRSSLQQKGRAMQFKIKQLCDANKDEEANEYMRQKRAEMLEDPEYLKLQRCNNSMISAFGGDSRMLEKIYSMPACSQIQMMGSQF